MVDSIRRRLLKTGAAATVMAAAPQVFAQKASFYEKGPVGLRLAAYSTSADLFLIGSDKTSDVFNATRTSMDFGANYAIAPHWVLYFNAKNLLNTPHAFYQGTSNRPIQREFYGQTYQLGARFDY